MRLWSLVLLVLVAGCQPPEPPPPPVPPPAEDLSTWQVPELVQPERLRPVSTVARPAKLPVGASEKVTEYKSGVTVEVPVAVGMPLDIVLEEGEQVRQIVDGDRAPAQEGQGRRWEVKEGGEGSGPTSRPHVFVTVTTAGLSNGVTVTTSKRTYYLTLKSVGSSPVRVLRWTYAQDGPQFPRPGTETPPESPGLLPHPEQPMHYHVGYVVQAQGRVPDWMPRAVIDDGKKTFIVYPEVALFDTVPLVRLVGPNGPQLVNARQFLNVVILDQLVARAELRVGIGEQAQVVTITRGFLRTIHCPGDQECPTWPAAASVLAGRTP